MACTISLYFTDDELVSKLRMYFKPAEVWDIDFYSLLKTNVEHIENDFCIIKIKNKKFSIDKITGAVYIN